MNNLKEICGRLNIIGETILNVLGIEIDVSFVPDHRKGYGPVIKVVHGDSFAYIVPELAIEPDFVIELFQDIYRQQQIHSYIKEQIEKEKEND